MNNSYCNYSSSILNFVSSLLIVIGLPIGFYIVFLTLNPIDHLKYVSYEIGEEFIRGVQEGINETALNELIKRLANTVISELILNQEKMTAISLPLPIPMDQYQ